MTTFYYRPQRSWGKVIFSQVSVILFRGGYPSMHCRWYPSMPCSRSRGGGSYPSMPCRFPGLQPRGKFRRIWSRSTAKGEVEGDLVQIHSQGGSWGRSGPGPHSRGKLGDLAGGWGVPASGGACSGECADPRDGYCCGRYASYWNAFLYLR